MKFCFFHLQNKELFLFTTNTLGIYFLKGKNVLEQPHLTQDKKNGMKIIQ
jgi:hypothetical protein